MKIFIGFAVAYVALRMLGFFSSSPDTSNDLDREVQN